jgi:hypothetical protein
MPGDVPGFAALHESCDGSLRVSLKDLPQSRLARHEQAIAKLE